MSRVMPKPAAEFSALAIAKSRPWWSTSAAESRPATRSRPGLPTISPMKRMRIMPAGRSRRPSVASPLIGNVAAAVHARSASLARTIVSSPSDDGRASPSTCRMRRSARRTRAGKTAVTRARPGESSIRRARDRRPFFAGDQQPVARAQDAQRLDRSTPARSTTTSTRSSVSYRSMAGEHSPAGSSMAGGVPSSRKTRRTSSENSVSLRGDGQGVDPGRIPPSSHSGPIGITT